MNILIVVVVVILLAKYVCILLGYVICFIVSLIMFRRGMLRKPTTNSQNFKSGGSIIKDFFVRIIHGWMRYSLIFTGRIPSHIVRNFIYKNIYFLDMDKKAIIYGGAEIRSPYNIKIGRGSIIGDNSKIDGRNGIIIGKNVNLSADVSIWTDQHDPQSSDFSNNGGPVKINDRAWISSRVTILPNISIGEGAVIAAGAVVTKDVEPFSIYGGVPAKKIGDRNRNLTYEFDGKNLFFY